MWNSALEKEREMLNMQHIREEYKDTWCGRAPSVAYVIEELKSTNIIMRIRQTLQFNSTRVGQPASCSASGVTFSALFIKNSFTLTN